MKKFIKLFSILLLVVLLISTLCSCVTKLSEQDISKYFSEALSESLKADIYYWKETIMQKNAPTIFNKANVHTELDNKEYLPILDSNGDYKTLMINVNETIGENTQLEYLCGLSNSTDKKNESKNYLFTKTLVGEDYTRSKTEMTAKDFYSSDTFKKYLLSEKIKELNNLTIEDMDFDIKEANSIKQFNLIEFTFKIKDSYFEKEGVDRNTSIFANTSRIFIEIAYGRISNITTFELEDIEGKFTIENEKYKFEVVYLGPKVKLPKYDEPVSAKDKSPLWKNA